MAVRYGGPQKQSCPRRNAVFQRCPENQIRLHSTARRCRKRLDRGEPCLRTARQDGREEEVFGSFLFRLFFLFLLLRPSKSRARSVAAAACCCDSWCFTCSLVCFSSSSSFLSRSAAAVRKRNEESTASPADPAREGEGRQAVPCGAPQAAVAPLRPGLRKDARPRSPEVESSVPVGRRASLAPPPPLCW